jgi:hypothetical protein
MPSQRITEGKFPVQADFRLLMISAMYENGGNTTHRFLDGHPQMYVYPFESQLGTRYVQDHLSSMFPVKYRWPAFLLGATPEEDYLAIVDEECKVRARTPRVSKFREAPFDFDDDVRRSCYCERVRERGQSRGGNVEAFFRATFDAWKDYRRTGQEAIHVGYSPIVVVDAEKILRDLPGAHVLHVVRNPWSAYADTKKRPVPLGLSTYVLAWTINQYFALTIRDKYPDRVHLVRIEDVMADPMRTLGALCAKLGLETAPSLEYPSWNGAKLDEVYPWGTIRRATPSANLATAQELSDVERHEVRDLAWRYLDAFDYRGFI